MKTFQIIAIVLLVIKTLVNIYNEINGRAAKEPLGFEGVCYSLIGAVILFWIYYKAGLFSCFLSGN